MRIQFEIQETLAGILDQLLHSDFWITEVEEVSSNKKIIRIRDFAYPQEAVAEVTDKEIILHIHRCLSRIAGAKIAAYPDTEGELPRPAGEQQFYPGGKHA